MWEENQKFINIVDEKTFQLGLKTEKEKPRLVERELIVRGLVVKKKTWSE